MDLQRLIIVDFKDPNLEILERKSTLMIVDFSRPIFGDFGKSVKTNNGGNF